MRLYIMVVLAPLTLLGACANEYSSVPEPKGEWVAVNPPGWQPTPPEPPAPPVRPVYRARVRRPVHPATRTAETHP